MVDFDVLGGTTKGNPMGAGWATASSGGSGQTSYQNTGFASGLKGTFDAMPMKFGTASSTTVYRGYDSGGLNQYVIWTANTKSPLPAQTTPNFTGTLIDVHVLIP